MWWQVIAVAWCYMIIIIMALLLSVPFNPSNPESNKRQRFLKTIETLSCSFSLDSSRALLSDEYPCARVSVIFQGFCILLLRPN